MANILETVKSVLSSPSAKRIDFHLGTINVDAAGIAAIHNLVAVGTIHISVGNIDPGAEAQYSPKTNTLEFPRDTYGANDEERAAILHECIHALHDMYGGGTYFQKAGSMFTPRSENEATAYVAGALFYVYETGRALSQSDPIFDIADMIAKRIKNKPGAFVTVEEARALRIAIISDPVYPYAYDALTIADGP